VDVLPGEGVALWLGDVEGRRDDDPGQRAISELQQYWRRLGAWTAESWKIPFAVEVDGRLGSTRSGSHPWSGAEGYGTTGTGLGMGRRRRHRLEKTAVAVDLPGCGSCRG
jgi:hypothetical protein